MKVSGSPVCTAPYWLPLKLSFNRLPDGYYAQELADALHARVADSLSAIWAEHSAWRRMGWRASFSIPP